MQDLENFAEVEIKCALFLKTLKEATSQQRSLLESNALLSKLVSAEIPLFTRLHTQDKYPGSGVGLALCRKIRKNHNGYITADGFPGVGTTISLFFPR